MAVFALPRTLEASLSRINGDPCCKLKVLSAKTKSIKKVIEAVRFILFAWRDLLQ